MKALIDEFMKKVAKQKLDYESDWNTLIPVINMIDSMYPYASSGNWYEAYKHEIHRRRACIEQIRLTKFEYTESVVIKFITEYNKGFKKYGDY